ncbi:uncharacterized protein LOC135341705 [Halichondria panicea]|uniref:uncharacterized protein LOC135341705 n=1 Tax=Halichondria panicea TaxID=6063 RepID=UPI00312BB634
MATAMAEIEPISVPRWAGLVHCKKLGGAQDCTNCAGCSDHITTSYKSHYEGKRPAARMPLRPSSLTRKHNPQPRHVFLLRRAVPNKPVCNVWTKTTPPTKTVEEPIATESSVDLTRPSKTQLTSAKSSYKNTDGHLNFQSIPTRFGSNKLKMVPAKGIVPTTCALTTDSKIDTTEPFPSIPDEPLNKAIQGGKRKLNASYVLNQHLIGYDAMKDVKARAQAGKDDRFSFLSRTSRKKHVPTLKSNLSGSSIAVRSNKKAAPRVAKVHWNEVVESCTPKPTWMYL